MVLAELGKHVLLLVLDVAIFNDVDEVLAAVNPPDLALYASNVLEKCKMRWGMCDAPGVGAWV